MRLFLSIKKIVQDTEGVCVWSPCHGQAFSDGMRLGPGDVLLIVGVGCGWDRWLAQRQAGD